MSANFDLTNLALQSVCPNNELIYDDSGYPSVMVKIPKMTYAQLGIGTSTKVHPAFIVNDKEVDAIYISKYQNVVQDGRAYSLPGRDPAAGVPFDTARSYCETKGAGWHLMTRAEWALIALQCMKNGFLPYGNNDYGKDSREEIYKAIPTRIASGKAQRVATGTGPLTWSHDGTLSGIWDLNGNLFEWAGGIRNIYGEVQVLANNNGADSSHSQATDSTKWVAIDATTGEYITPDGSGTTANSVKIDSVSDVAVYSTNITTRVTAAKNCAFSAVTCDATIAEEAKLKLYGLGLLPYETTAEKYEDDVFYFVNGTNAERLFLCGGPWTFGPRAGVFCLHGNYPRTNRLPTLGFRSAFVKLPTE